MDQKTLLLAPFLIGGLTVLALAPLSGAPWTPELVSPENNSLASTNPPELCAKDLGDPEGEAVYIRFEAWGGNEGGHGSEWIQSPRPGSVICWTDSIPWTTETHNWQARARDAGGSQSGASPDWKVNIPEGSQGGSEGSGATNAGCELTEFWFSPEPPQKIGLPVQIHISASCTNGVEMIKVFVEGTKIGTIAGGSGTVVWETYGEIATAYSVKIEVVDKVAGTLISTGQNYDLVGGKSNPSPSTPQTTLASGDGDPSGDECPTYSARLEPGDIAVVAEFDEDTLNMRVQPDISANIVYKLPSGSYVSIIAGPVCKDGYRWFEVGYEGKGGWSAEVGEDGEYNLAPNQGVSSSSGSSSSSPTATPRSTKTPDTLPDYDFSEPEVSQDSASLKEWCSARVQPVDEGRGTLTDKNFFLYVYLDKEPPKGTFEMTFLGIRYNLALWSEGDGHLRYGVNTWFGYISLGAWKNENLWSYNYEC